MNLTENQEKGLLDRLFRTPSGRKMQQEMEAEEVQQSARKAALDELPKLRDERVAMIARQMVEHDMAVEAIRETQRAYLDARQAGLNLGSRHHGEMFVIDTRIAEAELFLRETAPTHLNEKITELEAEIAAIRAEEVKETLVGANRLDAHITTNYADRSKRIKIALQEIQRLKSRMMTEA